MSQVLCFNDVQFDVISQNSQPWIRGSQIATALQYASVQRIIELYTRHADEFTHAMTAVVTLPTQGGPQETRIFSLRGCHLLAMFARTPVAKAFRKWVLDVLDKLAEQERLKIVAHDTKALQADALTPSTAMDRAALRNLVTAWARLTDHDHRNLYPQINAYLGIRRLRDIAKEQIPDACAWVQARIDALTAQESLPASPESVDQPAAPPLPDSPQACLIPESSPAPGKHYDIPVFGVEAIVHQIRDFLGVSHPVYAKALPDQTVVPALPQTIETQAVETPRRDVLRTHGEPPRPDSEYVSRPALMELLGLRSDAEFDDFVYAHSETLMRLPCGTRRVLAWDDEGEDYYHLDMVKALMAVAKPAEASDPAEADSGEVKARKSPRRQKKARRPRGVMFIEDVVKALRISKSTLYRAINKGLFPKSAPIINTGGKRGWKACDIRALLDGGLSASA